MKIMELRQKSSWVLIGILLIFLQGCKALTENVRLGFADDMSSTFHVLISHPSSPSHIEDIPGKLIEFDRMAKNCGATTRIFRRASDKSHVLQVQLDSKTQNELEISMECAIAIDSRFPKFTIEKNETLFSSSVTLRASSKTDYLYLFDVDQPLSITVAMPAPISSFTDTSKSRFDSINAEIHGNKAIIVVSSQKISEKEYLMMFDTICKKQKIDCLEKIEAAYPRDLGFELSSSRSKLTLQDVFAILGVLLGSGLLIAIGKRIFLRFAREK